MTHFSYSRDFKGVAEVFLRSPDVYRPLLEFIETVMVGDSELSKVEREIIAAHVSNMNGCDFCLQAHRATLTAMGASNDTVRTLDQGMHIEGVSNSLKHLLMFAEKLTRTPATIRQSDIESLIKAGIAEQTIEDTINVIALFNYVNRLVDAFGVEGNPDYFKMVGSSLAKSGYANLLPARAS